MSDTTPEPAPRRRLPLAWLVRVLGLVASLVLVSLVVDLRAATRAVLAVPLEITAAALALSLLRTLLAVQRWRVLIPPDVQLSFRRLFTLSMAAGAVGLLLPGIFGSDMLRGYGAYRGATNDRGGAAFSVLLDRLAGFVSILVLGLCALAAASDLEGRWRYFALVAALLAALWTCALLATSSAVHTRLTDRARRLGALGGRVASFLDRVFETLRGARRNAKRFWLAVAISLPIHVAWFLVVWLVAGSLGISSGFFALAGVTILVWLMIVVPVSLAGIGIRELGFVFLLANQGASEVAAGALALYQSALIVLVAQLGLPFLWYELLRRRPVAGSERQPP